MGEIGHQVLDDVHRGQRGDADVALDILDRGGAGEAVLAVHVHRTRPANPLPARPAEGERGIDLRLDLDQRVEHHRAAIVEIDGEAVIARVFARVRIVTVHLEGFFALRIVRCGIDLVARFNFRIFRE